MISHWFLSEFPKSVPEHWSTQTSILQAPFSAFTSQVTEDQGYSTHVSPSFLPSMDSSRLSLTCHSSVVSEVLIFLLLSEPTPVPRSPLCLLLLQVPTVLLLCRTMLQALGYKHECDTALLSRSSPAPWKDMRARDLAFFWAYWTCLQGKGNVKNRAEMITGLKI